MVGELHPKINWQSVRHVHFIGIGGVNMSAVAKLFLHAGFAVSGSDVAANEFTDELKKKKIKIGIGHAAGNVPPETDLIVYSSAVPEENVERAAGRKRGLVQVTNFECLGQWIAAQGKRLVLITGTHGKSTTTALAGLMLADGGLDPTVIVGSRVPSFPEGNIRFGASDIVVLEGDEYAKHFLAFEPFALIVNNIEWDHTDVFASVSDLLQAFRELSGRMQPGGLLVANADDPCVSTLIGEERARLESRGISIRTFGFGSHADLQIVDHGTHPAPFGGQAGEQSFAVRDEAGLVSRYLLHVPGRMNISNATGASALAMRFGVPPEAIRMSLGLFRGIWRRFEIFAGTDQISIVSDYGHHPTAVAATLEAAKAWFPGRRIVLCFQPHHHNRTKHLFLDFVPSFDKADLLLLVEIYDVAGRDAAEDQNISSRDLCDAVLHHDAERGARRTVEFAENPDQALAILRRWKEPHDVMVVMGAGDVYRIVERLTGT